MDRELRSSYREPRQAYREPRNEDREPKQAFRDTRPAYRETRPAYRETRPAYREPRPAQREFRQTRDTRQFYNSEQDTNSSGQKRGVSADQLRPCKFGHRCDRGVNCRFLHLPSDFLPIQGSRRN